MSLGASTAAFWLAWTLGGSSLFVGYAITGALQSFQLGLIVVVAMVVGGSLLLHRHLQQRQEGLTQENAQLKAAVQGLAEAFEGIDVGAPIEADRVLQGSKAHHAELADFLARSRGTVTILCNAVNEYGLSNSVKRRFREALNRDVTLRIGWGYQTNAEARSPEPELNSAERWLYVIESEFPGRVVLARFRNHQKLLLSDDEMILGSHNWLSNSSSPNEELSAVVTAVALLEQVRRAVDPIFAAPTTWMFA